MKEIHNDIKEYAKYVYEKYIQYQYDHPKNLKDSFFRDIVASSIISMSKENNTYLLVLEEEIQETKEDLELLEASLVGSGENYDSVGSGTGNGLVINSVEMKHLQIIKLRDKLFDLGVQRTMERQAIRNRNKLVKRAILSLPTNNSYSIYSMLVMRKKSKEVAMELGVEDSTIRTYSKRGLEILIEAIKSYIATIETE